MVAYHERTKHHFHRVPEPSRAGRALETFHLLTVRSKPNAITQRIAAAIMMPLSIIAPDPPPPRASRLGRWGG